MGNTKHKQKKKKRHERQIAEGTRVPVVKMPKRTMTIPYRRVYLSDMDRDDVRAVLDLVKDLKL